MYVDFRKPDWEDSVIAQLNGQNHFLLVLDSFIDNLKNFSQWLTWFIYHESITQNTLNIPIFRKHNRDIFHKNRISLVEKIAYFNEKDP